MEIMKRVQNFKMDSMSWLMRLNGWISSQSMSAYCKRYALEPVNKIPVSSGRLLLQCVNPRDKYRLN